MDQEFIAYINKKGAELQFHNYMQRLIDIHGESGFKKSQENTQVPKQYTDLLNAMISQPYWYGETQIREQISFLNCEAFITSNDCAKIRIFDILQNTGAEHHDWFKIFVYHDIENENKIFKVEMKYTGIYAGQSATVRINKMFLSRMFEKANQYNKSNPCSKEVQFSNSECELQSAKTDKLTTKLGTKIMRARICEGGSVRIKDNALEDYVVRFSGFNPDNQKYYLAAHSKNTYILDKDQLFPFLAVQFHKNNLNTEPLKIETTISFGTEMFDENYLCRIERNKGLGCLMLLSTTITNLGPNAMELEFVDKKTLAEAYVWGQIENIRKNIS